MSDLFAPGPAARYSLGAVVLALVSLYGFCLLIMAWFKNNVTIKGITLSISSQVLVGFLLQTPILLYIYIGFYTGIL